MRSSRLNGLLISLVLEQATADFICRGSWDDVWHGRERVPFPLQGELILVFFSHLTCPLVATYSVMQLVFEF